MVRGVDDACGAVAEFELGEDTADVALDGEFGDDESGGDLGMRIRVSRSGPTHI